MIKDIIFKGDGVEFQVTGKCIYEDAETITLEPLTEDAEFIPEHIPEGFILSSDYAVEFGEMACLTRIYTEAYIVALTAAITGKITASETNTTISQAADFHAYKAVENFGKQFGLTHIIKGLKENG